MTTASNKPSQLIPAELIERKIYLIRGHKVMLDRDLAKLYGVEAKVLNQAVKRNIERFPEDFMFRLTSEEAQELSRSQIVTLKRGQNILQIGCNVCHVRTITTAPPGPPCTAAPSRSPRHWGTK